MFLIEVAACGVDRDKKVGRNREHAFDEPVISDYYTERSGIFVATRFP